MSIDGGMGLSMWQASMELVLRDEIEADCFILPNEIPMKPAGERHICQGCGTAVQECDAEHFDGMLICHGCRMTMSL